MVERIHGIDWDNLSEERHVLNQRLEVARDVAREMQLTLTPDITDERLEDLTVPRYKRDEEFGWEWSKAMDVDERRVYGCLSLDVVDFEDMYFRPTGDVTFSASTNFFLLNGGGSSSNRDGYWSEVVKRDDSMEEFSERVLERLMSAWEELHEKMPQLPQLVDKQRAEEEAFFSNNGFVRTSYGWAREQE